MTTETTAGSTIQDLSYSRHTIDLTTGTATASTHQCQDIEDVLGGIARGFKVLETCPVTDAYSPDATLLLTLGVLSGSNFMTGLRTYFLGYSPLKRSSTGLPSAMWSAGSGKFGTKLRHLGVDELLMTGRSPTPVLLYIGRESDAPDSPVVCRFEDASDLVGLRVNAKIQALQTRFGSNAHFAVIGPAGEHPETVRYAAVALSTENQLKSGDPKARYCGRGGMGGLMGSKNLLAIVADTPDVRDADAPGFTEFNKEIARGEGSARFRDDATDRLGGTWANYVPLNQKHALPELNFNPTGTEASFALHRQSVQESGQFIVKDESCYRCGIKCHKNIYDAVDGQAGKFRGKLDYEPLNLLASNLGIYDADQACTIVELVDELGMDSISCGVSLSYAMEFNRRHADDGQALAAGPWFGDFESILAAVNSLGAGQDDLIGQGVLRMSERLGEPGYAMHCKGLELPAYLPQTNPGYPWALAGGHMSMRTFLLLLFEGETSMDYWVGAITEPNRGLVQLPFDMVGICKFAGVGAPQMATAVSELTGLEVTPETISEMTVRTFLRGYRLEKLQGMTRDDYVLPGESHREYPNIDLPYFVTEEFFSELQEKVMTIFDTMLAEIDIGPEPASAA
ncbi:MAG: aldehyde ferredoxin oxidoreductase C-terminal domain-containing protein [Planctomycetaceae bacterium]|jgi:aldehyde:ferredoxin oxidoreductase|nr:aldehyde ferredoxin oxidoreductase C-terminal domain-containing protein [Planctomycetaceae bacterium]